MNDRIVGLVLVVFGTAWLLCIIAEVAFKLWQWSQRRESIGDRWQREDQEGSKGE